MRYLSVCSGIEAATVAWHSLGWQAVGFSEIEKFPAKVLAHHYPSVPNFGDLTQHDRWPLESGSVDLLVGGTPCQSFSVAGLRRGLDDSRGQLTFEYVRLAQRLRPRWIVWENVPGVLSSGGGQDFAAFLSGLSGRDIQPPDAGWKNSGVVEPSAISNVWAKLLETNRGLQSRPVQLRGQQDRRLSSVELPRMPDERFDEQPSFYGIAWRVLDAQYFGVAQRRRRVFVVGYLGDWRRAAAVLFERESVRGDPAPSREKRQTTPTVTKEGTGVSRPGHNEDGWYVTAPSLVASGRGCARTGDSRGQDPVVAVQKVVGTLDTRVAANSADNASRGHLLPTITHSLRARYDGSEDGTGRGVPLVPSWPAEVAPTLNAHFGSKQGLEDQHALGGAGHFVPAVAKTIAVQAAEPLPFDTTQMTSKANRSHPRPGDPCHPLAAGAHPPAVAMALSAKDNEADADDIAPTLTASNDPSRSPQSSEITAQVAAVVRSLATRDVAQTITSNYAKQPDNSDTGLGPNLVIGLDEEQNARLDGFGTLKARTNGGGFEGCVMIAGQSVAWQQNTRNEVRLIGGDGQIAGALAAEADMKQQNYIAIGADLYNGAITGDVAATMGTPGSSVNASGPTVITHPLGAKDNGLGVGIPFSVCPDHCGGDKKGQDVAFVKVIDTSRTLDCTGADVSRKQGGVGVAMAVPIDLRNAQRDPDKHDAVNRQGTGVAKDGDPAHTVTSACVQGVATAMQVRRLTPIECERLQGFPDGYTDIRPRGKDTPDGPRYKALGNSMAVPVMRWIGERIAKVEEITKG